jgi:predicted tellurium resistance membrane protein TerC
VRAPRGFLLMIGMVLIAEGFGAHVPKGCIYATMNFSTLDLLSRRATQSERQKRPECP